MTLSLTLGALKVHPSRDGERAGLDFAAFTAESHPPEYATATLFTTAPEPAGSSSAAQNN